MIKFLGRGLVKISSSAILRTPQNRFIFRRNFTQIVPNSTPIDPASSLSEYYGEKLTVEKETISPSNVESNNNESICSLSVSNILSVIKNECDSKVCTYTTSKDNIQGLTPVQIILSMSTNRERIAMAESLLKKFRPFLKAAQIPVDGLHNKLADWIVVDLEVAMVHIFDPKAREAYGIDAKFNNNNINDSNSEITAEGEIEKFSVSKSRKDARRPSIE